jgi:YesN/AraC family two-component response regulator
MDEAIGSQITDYLIKPVNRGLLVEKLLTIEDWWRKKPLPPTTIPKSLHGAQQQS